MQCMYACQFRLQRRVIRGMKLRAPCLDIVFSWRAVPNFAAIKVCQRDKCCCVLSGVKARPVRIAIDTAGEPSSISTK